MARKKVALTYIRNDASRKASLRKRRKGLINKVREISTLCAVEACAVIYSPDSRVPEVWPSNERARAILRSYLAIPAAERAERELNPESFMLRRIKKIREKVERIQKENKRRDLEMFMYRCMYRRDSVANLSVRDRCEMEWTIDQVTKDIRSRWEKLRAQGASNSSARVIVPPSTTAMAPAAHSSPSTTEEEINVDKYLALTPNWLEPANVPDQWDVSTLHRHQFDGDGPSGSGSGSGLQK